jgi:phosphopantothenoylcysteine decarboxylase
METAWANDGQQSSSNAIAGPSNPVIRRRSRMKATKPFVSANHKPAGYDNIFRVVIITSGSVASVKLPLIVGELSKVCMHLVADSHQSHGEYQD